MNVDFSKPILNLDGEAMNEGGAPVTLGIVSINALLATLEDGVGRPEQLQGTEKVKMAVLAQVIHSAKDVIDLESEQIQLLKDRIGRCYTSLAVMRAWNLLEGKE